MIPLVAPGIIPSHRLGPDELEVQTLAINPGTVTGVHQVCHAGQVLGRLARNITIIMQIALSNLPRAHVPVACTPRRTSCFRSARAVTATAQEAAPAQQLSKPAPHGRLYNFAAGPAVLPVEVLEEAQQGLLNWKGSGTSVMEMSHRGKEFSSIIQHAEDDLRSLLNIPDNYQVGPSVA